MSSNPVSQQTAMGELAQDVLTIQSTTGSRPGPMARVPQFLFVCAPSRLLQRGLPKYVQGVAGLGHAPIALPTQLASHFGFSPILPCALLAPEVIMGSFSLVRALSTCFPVSVFHVQWAIHH